MGCKMNGMKRDEDWQEDDATWELLGRAAPLKAGDRFADDVVRAVRTMPEKDSVWSGFLGFAPWVGAAACAVFASWFFFNQPGDSESKTRVTVSNIEEQWGEIEDVAEVEMLSAAAEHLDQFSDQELITMIGL